MQSFGTIFMTFGYHSINFSFWLEAGGDEERWWKLEKKEMWMWKYDGDGKKAGTCIRHPPPIKPAH